MLHSIGTARIIFLALVIAIAACIIYAQFIQSEKLPYLIALLLSIVFLIHYSREDKRFLNIIFEKPQLIFVLEYTILSSPLLLPLLCNAQWMYTISMVSGVIFIACFKVSFRNSNTTLFSSIIPNHNFEWISGVRKNLYFLIMLYAATIASAFFNSYLSLFFIWLISLIISTFYIVCEPQDILCLYANCTNKFLKRKIFAQLRVFISFTLPVIILVLIIHPTAIIVVTLFYFFQLTNTIFFVALKYSLYTPNKRADSILLPLASFNILIPFFLPVPLIMLPKHLRLSKKKLSIYLND